MNGKPLIIAEKPSAARAIADALGGFAQRTGYMESSRYYLSWAVGHLVELMSPEEYDARYKRWSLTSLPILPPVFGLKVTAKTKSQFDLLVRLASHASSLINACDAAREGELIFRYICQAGRIQLPAQRLWVSALTPESIRKAFASLQPESEYDRLYESARCRAQGDWLMGMNTTRAFTVKWGELYSVGRVQTPTLAMIVRREQAIESFKPEPYWEVVATFTAAAGTYKGKWFDGTTDRIGHAEQADAIAARVRGEKGQVEKLEEKPVAEKPPQLYDLTTLQREANRRFGLTAAATLKAAQSLYEAKLITYPRTDSRYLNRDLVKELPGVVRSLANQADFRVAAEGADLSRVSAKNYRVVNDSKVTDHHAIIPTTEPPGKLGAAEAKIYGLIARRFLAQFYPEAKFVDSEVITRVGGLPDRFRSRGRRVVDPGWRVVEPEPAGKKKDEEQEETPVLPDLKPADPVKVKTVEAARKETQPPRRYSEATLLSAMETAGREMDDEALKEAMKGHGLGTPATRAAIIERLKDVGYINLEKKALVPTAKGRQLVALAEQGGAGVLLSPELTGEWEKRIADIQAGAYEPSRFMAEIRDLVTQVVDSTKNAAGGSATGRGGRTAGTAAAGGAGVEEAAAPVVAAGRCPVCGKPVSKEKRDWTCGGTGCALRIPGWLCGKTVDAPLVGTLLTKGRSSLITGFRSPRTGKSFNAFLVLKEGRLEFEFPPDKPRKASGYRSASKEAGTGDQQEARAKTGSRQTGSRTGGKSGGTGRRSGSPRVGRGTARTSESAGTLD